MTGMEAALVAVGSELLGADRSDTNSSRLAAALAGQGVAVRRRAIVGDDEAAIAGEVARAVAEGIDLLILSGGLGPTADDVTREGVAMALARGLEERPEILADIAARFEGLGLRMPEVNRRQARIMAGAEVLPNRRGTAPGQRLAAGKLTLFLFPAVPDELEGMIEEHLVPWLAERGGGEAREMAVLKVACLPESAVEERIGPFYEAFGREGLTVLASAGEIQLRLTAAGSPDGRRRWLAPRLARLRELLGERIFADRPEVSLEGVVGDLLRRAGASLATAESCTGGLLAERLTRVPGASDYFLGSVVSYSDRLKIDLLGIPAELLAREGAVSAEVARAMASAARRLLGADLGVALTGVAGPGGGSAAKPVGTVHLAIAGPGEALEHRHLRFPGDRERIRWLASQWALDRIRRGPLARRAAAGAAGGEEVPAG
jgi:nicotinamide-nucleotide amidase